MAAAARVAATSELDESAKISRLTATYDSSLLSYAAYQSLARLAAPAA